MEERASPRTNYLQDMRYEMSQDNYIASRITLLVLQLLIVAVVCCNVAVTDLSRDDKVFFAALLVCSMLFLSVPQSLWDGRWTIYIPTILNAVALVSLSFHTRTIPAWMHMGYVLVSLMASNGTSVMQIVILNGMACVSYAASLSVFGVIHDEHILLLPVMGILTLVSVSKTRCAQAVVRDRSALQEEVRCEAMCDYLTGLPNRTQYIERVWRAVDCAANNKSFLFAVLFIDLDGFKPINDQLGHKAGDAVLKEVALRLQACLRKGDSIGRYGGDEFTFLLNNVSGELDAARMAQRVLHKLQDPIKVGKKSVRVGASIGITLSTDFHTRPEDLIRDADAAMYRAKAKGKNCYEISNQLCDAVA